MQPSLLDLINTVHYDRRDHWRSRRDKVHQGPLRGRREKKNIQLFKTWKILSQEFTARSRLKKQIFSSSSAQRRATLHPSAQCCRIAYPELPCSQLNTLRTLHPYHPLPWLLNDTLASSFASYYAALSNRSSSIEGRLVGA